MYSEEAFGIRLLWRFAGQAVGNLAGECAGFPVGDFPLDQGICPT